MAGGEDAPSSSNRFVPIAPAPEKRTTLSTEEYMKQTCETICTQTLNERASDDLLMECLAPDVLSIHESTGVVQGRGELMENLRALLESMPNYSAEVLNTTVTVDERKGTGTVYLHLFLSGMPDGIRRESVNVLEWRRKDGVWLITKHSGHRGPPIDGGIFHGMLGEEGEPP